jgi:hypothetical protein
MLWLKLSCSVECVEFSIMYIPDMPYGKYREYFYHLILCQRMKDIIGA